MRATVIMAILAVGFVPSASAQERLRFSVNAADQVTSQTLNQNFTIPINVEHTATFTGAPLERIEGHANGYHAGVDVSWRLSRSFAVGGLVRFTGASPR